MKILITEADYFPKDVQEMLKELGDVNVIETNMNILIDSIRDIDILLIGLELNINKNVLDSANKLKIIGTPTTGLDHIDLNIAKEKGISIISLKGDYKFTDKIHASYEHTIALILTLIRKIPSAFDSVKNYSWERKKFVGHELKNKTLGILGYGRIGKKVAKICSQFQMKVIANDLSNERIKKDGFEAVTKKGLFQKADIVIICVPLEESTINFVNEKEISLMKNGSWIINISRGKILNEEALLQVLNNHKLAGAAVDVLSTENTPSHPFSNKLIEYAINHDNLIITPHIAGSTFESMRMTGYYIAEKVIKLIKNNNIKKGIIYG